MVIEILEVAVGGVGSKPLLDSTLKGGILSHELSIFLSVLCTLIIQK